MLSSARQRLSDMVLRVSFLALALVGYWSPWLTHPAAALRLNGYELSEWVTFLPSVRAGEWPLAYLPFSLFFARLAFLLPLACLALLLAIAAYRFRPAAGPRRSWWQAAIPTSVLSWILLLLALVFCYTVFPPYPYLLTAYRDPEFELHFFAACATLAGLLLVPFLTAELKDALQTLLAAAGGLFGLVALLAVQPTASNVLQAVWPIGPGWGLMLLGFTGLAAVGWTRFFGLRE